MTIRRRLLGISAGALAIGIAVVLVIGNILLADTIDGLTSRLLTARAEAEIAALRITPTGVLAGDAINDARLDANAWIFNHGRLRERPQDSSPALDRIVTQLSRRGHRAQITSPGGDLLLSVPLTAGRPRRRVGAAVVELSLAPFTSLKQDVLIGSLILGSLLLIGAAIAVDRSLRRALGSVAAMTSAAEDWSEHDLDRRFALGHPEDEIGALATVLDHMLERIAASRRHERRFAGDVAHELRTPLAAIRGLAEFAADPRSTGGEKTANLKAIEVRAMRMSDTVDTLLAVARHEIDPLEGRVDLLAVAREFSGGEVTVRGEPARAEGDADIIRRALAPLVENARRHAAAKVTLEVTARHERARITVRDDGPGVGRDARDALSNDDRRAAREPGARPGLGLPLARRLARACGGDVLIGEGPGGCFILEFPLAPARTTRE